MPSIFPDAVMATHLLVSKTRKGFAIHRRVVTHEFIGVLAVPFINTNEISKGMSFDELLTELDACQGDTKLPVFYKLRNGNLPFNTDDERIVVRLLIS